MTVYVDAITTYGVPLIKGEAKRYGTKWSHMWTDGDLEELHEFALSIGMKRRWFQPHHIMAHYDIVPSRRERAIKAGAIEASIRDHIKATWTDGSRS